MYVNADKKRGEDERGRTRDGPTNEVAQEHRKWVRPVAARLPRSDSHKDVAKFIQGSTPVEAKPGTR